MVDAETGAAMTRWQDELAGGLRGRARRDAATLEAYSVDYGRQVERRPAVVVSAADEGDVAHVMRVSKAHGVPVAVRGEGHSFSGQTLCDGIVLCLPPGDVEAVDDETFRVPAGAVWTNVEAALNEVGRTVPVLTNHLETTVGGTLSTGGYGLRSIAHGAQVDHVTRLRVVLPEGRAVWCSPDEQPELFGAMLGGFGQCGVMTEAVMRSRPMPPSLTVSIDAWRSLAPMARSLSWTLGEHAVDHFFAYANNDEVVTARASAAPTGLRGRLVPADALALRAPSPVDRTGRKHVWCDFGLSWEAFVSFAEMLDERLQDAWLRIALDRVNVLVLKRPVGRAALFDLRDQPGRGPVFSVGLFFHVAADDAEVLRRVSAFVASCVEMAGASGARPYLQGTFGPGTAALFYPEALARCRELRGRFDGSGLLNPSALL